MNRIFQWWLNVNFKIRLISIMILVISILMSTITFVLLSHLQREFLDTDLRFCRDFSIMLAHDIVRLIKYSSQKDLKDFIEKIYLTASSIQYVRLFNEQGHLIVSFPMSAVLLSDTYYMQNNPLNLHQYQFLFNIPIVSNSLLFKYNTIHAILPLVQNSDIIGFLQLGFNSKPSILYITKIVEDLSILTFVSVWLMFILGIAFNFLIIAQPIRQLLIGLQNIASGNFDQKINVYFNGELSNLILSFNEMSKRLQYYDRKNIAQLASEKAKLEALVSTIADGAILLDTELRILFVNQIVINFFHWSNQDLLGKTIFQYLPSHVNDTLLPILNSMVKSNCLDNKVLQAREVIIDLHYESLKTFRFLLSTVFNQSNWVFHGVVIIIQDVTLEKQLNKAKNQFISNVSHELRTPLCNIGSFLETLIDYNHKLSSLQKHQFLSIAYAETQRLTRLVNDVLDLSRLESEYNYILKPITLNSTVDYIVQASQIIALNKQLQVVVETHPFIHKILAHESSLCQVFSNLISNSLKFTHKGGRIVIRVYPLIFNFKSSQLYNINPEIVRLEVIDEGIGIDKAFQRQIFDRFMRIENNIHTLEGTGLGLSIVKNIIKKHNSSISVYSEVGIGTSFWFDLFILI